MRVPWLCLLALLTACDHPDDDDTASSRPDDDTEHVDDDTPADDDTSPVLTSLTAMYGCFSEPGDGSSRPWYYYDPRTNIQTWPENFAYDLSENITDAATTYCDAIWNWDVVNDDYPTEPGWFQSGVVDLEEFHGIESIGIWLPALVPYDEIRCDLEPGATLSVRGAEDPDTLGDWETLPLQPSPDLPDDPCFRTWTAGEGGQQPAWAGQHLQFRIDLWRDPDEGYVQAAMPMFITYQTTVSYYYHVLNELFGEQSTSGSEALRLVAEQVPAARSRTR